LTICGTNVESPTRTRASSHAANTVEVSELLVDVSITVIINTITRLKLTETYVDLTDHRLAAWVTTGDRALSTDPYTIGTHVT
jgi:hypothetical protein